MEFVVLPAMAFLQVSVISWQENLAVLTKVEVGEFPLGSSQSLSSQLFVFNKESANKIPSPIMLPTNVSNCKARYIADHLGAHMKIV